MVNSPRTHIHTSDISSYLSCELKWYYGSPLRLGLQPKRTPRALQRGSLVHQVLDLWYSSSKRRPLKDCMKDAWDQEMKRLRDEGWNDMDFVAEEEDLAELKVTVGRILANYAAWAKTNDDYQAVHVEQNFVVPIEGDVDLAGKFDMIIRDRYNKLWVQDFKCISDFDGYANFQRSLSWQAKAYVWASQQLFNEPVQGIRFVLIKAKPPVEPRILDSGKLSTAKNQNTTAALYRKAMTELGLSVEDDPKYAEVITALEAKERENPQHQIVTAVFDKNALATFERQLRGVARRMTNPHEVLLPVGSLMSCRGCSYREPCAALCAGQPETAEMLLRLNYAPGKYTKDAQELEASENEIEQA